MGPLKEKGWYVDTTQDFMSTSERVVRMNQIASIIGPWLINTFFLYFYMSDDPKQNVTRYVTSTESLEMLRFQWYLQCVSVVCLSIFTALDWSGLKEQTTGPKLEKGVIAYIAFLITLIFVPIVSVVHWSTSFNAEDSKNTIVTWLSIYPMMGLMISLYIFGKVGDQFLIE